MKNTLFLFVLLFLLPGCGQQPKETEITAVESHEQQEIQAIRDLYDQHNKLINERSDLQFDLISEKDQTARRNLELRIESATEKLAEIGRELSKIPLFQEGNTASLALKSASDDLQAAQDLVKKAQTKEELSDAEKRLELATAAHQEKMDEFEKFERRIWPNGH